MQKNLKKVHFLKNFCKENVQEVTQPLKIFVQKSCFDVYVIKLEFKKNRSIRLKVWNLAFKGQYSLCHQLPSRFLMAVNSLDLDLSENMHYVADLHRPICFLFKIRNADFTV